MLNNYTEITELKNYQNYIITKFKDISEANYNEVLEISSDFLILWSLYENYCYNNFDRSNKPHLEKIQDKIDSSHREVLGIDEIFNHFNERYKNEPSKIELLFNGRHKYKNKIKTILEMDAGEITNREKQLFLSIILYRYRNNIIHGSKDYSNWYNYKSEIIKLTEFMYLWLKEYN